MSESGELRKSAPLESGKPPLSPAVKAWLDNVIVPALVKEWLAERSGGHGVDSGAESHDAESEGAKLREAIFPK